MKRLIYISLFVVVFSGLNFATVKFADEVIKKDFDYIIEKQETVRYLIDQLSSSDITYIIKYEDVGERQDGLLETDGNVVSIKIKEYGVYSLQAKFAYLATHALQFEAGKIAFFKNQYNDWKILNLDLGDEVEAFMVMASVDEGWDVNSKMVSENSTTLDHFKAKLDFSGVEAATEFLREKYPHLSEESMNNPGMGPDLVTNSRSFYKTFISDPEYLTVLSLNGENIRK